MHQIDLKFGRSSISFDYDPQRFYVLAGTADGAPLSDIEINKRLDEPIDCSPLEDIVHPGETVLFVVSDATRLTGCGQIINLLVRRLIVNGSAPHEMSVIFATGIHRPVTEEEKHEILTPFIAQRIKTLDHNPRDLMQILSMGETRGGITVELNRALSEFDHVILLGGVTFHYFAGFTGGRKLICPGLASARTISATHKLAFDCDRKTRREGVGTALLDGNAVHEAFVEAASRVNVSFSVNTIVNDAGEVVDLFCGDRISSHRTACDFYSERNTVAIAEKRDLVVASCGGSPHDINMIQAHKALEAASHACRDGGTIILLAECSEGMGRTDFIDWFSAENSEALAQRLCESYKVNGQTAWSLLRKAERLQVQMVSEINADELTTLRIEKVEVDQLKKRLESTSTGYILPFGARTLIVDNS